MSCFKRAEWHSGLTYQQVCRSCGTVMTYMDTVLDFRPWFPDGFVYCSRCKTPLRHSERYAVNGPAASSNNPQSGTAVFCSQCGKRYGAGDRFCSVCGTKRS